MASLVLFTSFFLVICMHSSNARLLHAIAKPSSTKSHHVSISFKVAEKNGGNEIIERTRAQAIPPATPFSKAEFKGSLKGNTKDGSDIVESSSLHHVALLKGKHVKDLKIPTASRSLGKKEVNHSEKDDIVVTDYQPPHRKAPIHNK